MKIKQPKLILSLFVALGICSIAGIHPIVAHAQQTEWNYNYTGYAQTFTAPYTGTYKLEVWGAEGGSGNESGGHGGYSEGEVSLTAGQKLYVYVGGQGTKYGGWNGGGTAPNINSNAYWGMGGGGATDIRTASDGNWWDYLGNRIVVAGGGGGYDNDGGFAGAGGGMYGTSSGNVPESTSSYGYALGRGEEGPDYGSGGGGGYYGGYAGDAGYGNNSGGGGSGYIGGVSKGQSVTGNTTMPAPNGGNETGQSGNGYARITMEYAPLSLSVSANTTNWTNQAVTLTATGSGGQEGFHRIELPNGNYINSTSASYTVSTNGSYTFKAEDNAGNWTQQTIKVGNIDTSSPTYSDIHLENVTETGFDISITVNDTGSGVDKIDLPVWREGNYAGMTDQTFTNQGNGTHVYHVNMSTIGAGSDYVYVGIHLWDHAGNGGFLADVPLKLDTTAPNLSLSQLSSAWTNQSEKVTATMSDNFNTIQSVSLSGTGMSQPIEINQYSKPKILSLIAPSAQTPTLNQLISDGYDVTVNPNVTSVSQLQGYDIIMYDASAWNISSQASNILNQAYADGYRIFTTGNDNTTNIHPITGYTYESNDGYGFTQYTNQGSASGNAFYTQGLPDHLMSAYDGKTEWDSSNDYITSWASDTRPISMNTTDPATANILYSINNQGGEWIHFQAESDHAAMTRRALDQLMWGTMATRQTYTQDFTIRQNGTYTITVTDFSGNKTSKTFTVSNIDKTTPTQPTIHPSATKWTNQNITFTVDGSTDTGSGLEKYQYQIDGGNWTDYRGTVTISNDGEHTISARAVDHAGNVSPVATQKVYLDKTPPMLNVTASATSWTNSDVVLNVTTSDSTSGLSGLQLPNGNWTQQTSVSYTVSQNGRYTFTAVDNAGNVTTKTVTVSNIDKTPPTAPTISNDGNWTKASSVPVSITSGTDGGSGVSHTEYSLSGATSQGWTTYRQAFFVTNEGVTTVSARTIDNTGNVSSVTTSTVRIDRTPPDNTSITIQLKH